MTKEFFEKCREHIRHNRFDALFTLMRTEFSSGKNRDIIDSIEGKYRQWKSDEMMGTTKYDDTRPAEVRKSALEFLTEKERAEDNKRSILFIGASPSDLSSINVNEEWNIVKNLTSTHEHLKAEEILDAKISDLFNYTVKYQPQILHIACHSNETGIFLMAEDGSKNKAFVDLNRFREFIAKFSRTIDCLILNSCASKDIGNKISPFIPFVVVTNQKIQDRASIEYAKGFYNYIAIENKINPNFFQAHTAGKGILNILGLTDAWTVEKIVKDQLNITN